MTKFTELLGKAGSRDNEPLGFGRGGNRSARTPDILVVARIGTKDLPKLDVEGFPADAFLLETEKLGAKALTAASKALDGAVWGVRIKAVGSDEVEDLKASGADFIVFEASDTRASPSCLNGGVVDVWGQKCELGACDGWRSCKCPLCCR